MEKEEKLKFFEKELNMISDEKLREFCIIMLDGTADWFYHDPASTSGKYHPKFALGDGGLVRHTKAVVYWLNELVRSEMFDVNERQAQLLIIGAIVHDIRKHDNNGTYIKNHAREARNLVAMTFKEHPELIKIEEALYIANAVTTHMGIWGKKDGEAAPSTDSEKILHLADLLASRKEIDMQFDDYVAPSPEESVPVAINMETYVFDFGKNAGKTLDQVYAEGDYLQWVAKQNEFGHPEVQKVIIEYLQKKGNIENTLF